MPFGPFNFVFAVFRSALHASALHAPLLRQHCFFRKLELFDTIYTRSLDRFFYYHGSMLCLATLTHWIRKNQVHRTGPWHMDGSSSQEFVFQLFSLRWLKFFLSLYIISLFHLSDMSFYGSVLLMLCLSYSCCTIEMLRSRRERLNKERSTFDKNFETFKWFQWRVLWEDVLHGSLY